jgi:release factor glutamine methyltransferase
VPVSAGEALQAAFARLEGLSSSPRRDAEFLLLHLLRWDRTALLTHPERPLSESETTQFETMIARRVAHEPMQYIVGSQEFFGLSLDVSPDVLIPRPETEHVVETVLESSDPGNLVRILDVGTGSGAIAIALAHALPRSQVTAVDISAPALAIAHRNAARHGVLDRMTFLQSDLLASVENTGFDVIVSNPPYIANSEILEPQVSQYEPHTALFAGPTGLEVYQRLIPQAHRLLTPGGRLVVEIGFGQQKAVEALFGGWRDVRSLQDLQGIPRVVQALKA